MEPSNNKIVEAFITSTTPSREEFPTNRVALKLANREHTHQASLRFVCFCCWGFFSLNKKIDIQIPVKVFQVYVLKGSSHTFLGGVSLDV